MQRQPVVNVGIMAEKVIRFKLETGYHHGTNQLKAGEYSIEIKDQKMMLQGEEILIITEEQIILLPLFRTNSFLLYGVTIGIQFHWEKRRTNALPAVSAFFPKTERSG